MKIQNHTSPKLHTLTNLKQFSKQTFAKRVKKEYFDSHAFNSFLQFWHIECPSSVEKVLLHLSQVLNTNKKHTKGKNC